MKRSALSRGGLVFVGGLCVALLLPAQAEAKGPSNDEVVTGAKGSQLFRRELRRDQLKGVGLEQIELNPGVVLDLQAWIRDTALDARPELAPLLDPKLPAGLLGGAPTYREAILELEDRLVIDRKLTIELAPGACARPDKPAAMAELCFTRNPGNKPDKAVTKDLAAIRAKLAKADAATLVRGGVTVAQAKAMTDEQLLDLLLNTGTRTIHQISIVPRLAVKAGALNKFDKKLDAAAIDTGLQVLPLEPVGPKGGLGPKGLGPIGGAYTYSYPRDYFLTGFTYGREIEDRWEYTIADSTWLTDRYFVRVDYHLSLGFGLRAPFAVDVKTSSTGTDSRSLELSVAPIDVDANGGPAYQAVGLPANQTFDGKEFVLEFKAGCNLYVSIPGPNIDRDCPSIDIDYSRDVDPVLGTDRSTIGDWWLDGNVTGLKVGVSAASASLDIGIGAEVTNGKIGARASGLAGSTLSGVGTGRLSFTNRNALTFGVTRTPGVAAAGLRLDQPTYGFDIRLTPKLRATIDIDVAIFEKRWVLGPWALGALSVSQSFQLGHHAGTVAQHDYEVFRVAAPASELDPGGVVPTTPKKNTAGKLPASPMLPK